MTESDFYAMVLLGFPCSIILFCIAFWAIIFTCCEVFSMIKGLCK